MRHDVVEGSDRARSTRAPRVADHDGAHDEPAADPAFPLDDHLAGHETVSATEVVLLLQQAARTHERDGRQDTAQHHREAARRVLRLLR